MLERIARKLCKLEYPDQPESWHEGAWDGYVEDAKCVVAEMREPTPRMIAACWDLEGSQRLIWERSIDAALRPT